ncbi:hypothetical protein FTV88_1631 [Heliorestis convoluta]|uniref:Uncharacterized protein n=1 Tax=Heliorestis convoluta TaxID=356322 RepID=A0A5Q2N648_9FIRM|nr:hypothetical protein FTV88_1631 [Heliorestis convoluta]
MSLYEKYRLPNLPNGKIKSKEKGGVDNDHCDEPRGIG